MTGLDTASQLRQLLLDARTLDVEHGFTPSSDACPGGDPDAACDADDVARALKQELVSWAGRPDRHDACLLAARAVVLLRARGEHKWASAFDAVLHLLTGVMHTPSGPPSTPR